METEAAGLSLSDGFDLSGMTLTELWLRYIGIGGSQTAAVIDRQLYDPTAIDRYQYNLLAQALNEHFIERQENHPVAYRAAAANA
jgi:hypothetical protein